MSTNVLAPPPSWVYRIALLVRATVTLARVEVVVRRRSPTDLCERFGLTFEGFTPPTQPTSRLTWSIAQKWWAVESTLRWWPWARRRPCLRRAAALGHLVRDRSPALCLEITSLAPFSAHAWLQVSGHRLDMGPTDESELGPTSDDPPIDAA